MNYLKKIELLENLVKQAQNINATKSKEPVFQMWQNDVKNELSRIYGNESFELKKFRAIRVC